MPRMDNALATQLANIEQKTGKTISELVELVTSRWYCHNRLVYGLIIVGLLLTMVVVPGASSARNRSVPPTTGLVCPLPENNLIRNPWFRTGNRPSLDGWNVVVPPENGWTASQKPGNPTPDDVVGTAARLSTGRGAERRGRTVDPHVETALLQVVSAPTSELTLWFDMYWVTHTLDPGVVTVYGGSTPDGPWTKVWTPFFQRFTKMVRPESGRGNDLWDYYTNQSSLVSTTLDKAYPYYKIEIRASLPDEHGGFKITGIYFSVADDAPDLQDCDT